MSPSSRAAQFSKTTRRADGSRRLAAHASLTKKAPQRGARDAPADLSADVGLLLRGCSFRDPKQERPRSIATDRRKMAPLSRKRLDRKKPANPLLRVRSGARTGA